MREAGIATAGGGTLCELFDRAAAAYGPHVALRKGDGSPGLTWTEYAARARAAAAGLAGIGIGPRDTVACWLRDRPELGIAHAGALRLGAVPFRVHPAFTPAQAEHVIGEAGSRVVLTEPAFFPAALAVRDARRTALTMIVLVEGADARALTWSELLDCARTDFDADVVARAVGPDDLATMIYHAGADGSPAAVRLTHRDVVALLAVFRDYSTMALGWPSWDLLRRWP
jgi:long-chain acyl-CoA synthetase